MRRDGARTKAMENFSFIRRLSQFGTRFLTLLYGAKAGVDSFGNAYYRSRKTPKGSREKRWVIYKGEPEASKIPPEWHIWLHHMANAPLEPDSPYRKPWQKPHQQNLTGGRAAWLPPGHTLKGNSRQKATGDYQAWNPGDAK